MKDSRIHFKSQGHKLVGILNQGKYKNSLVLLLHGLTNSMVDCPLIIEAKEAFRNQGFSTFSFDYYGSGLSEGEFKDKTFSGLVQNTHDALSYATKELHFQKIGIWGRSLGAILGATICDDKHIAASVFISFCVHTNISFSSFFPKNMPFSLPIKGTGGVKGEPILPYRFYEETNWIDELQKSHLANASKILVVQGTEDKTVYDTLWAKETYDMAHEPKKLIYIKGADHSYRGFEKQVINHGVKWFGKYLT